MYFPFLGMFSSSGQDAVSGPGRFTSKILNWGPFYMLRRRQRLALRVSLCSHVDSIKKGRPFLRGKTQPSSMIPLQHPQQTPGSGKMFCLKSHRHFDLIIALDDVWVVLTASEASPANESAHPGPMSVHRHRIITSVDQPFAQG